MGPSGGDEVVDVTLYLERKLAALEAHASQIAQVPRSLREFLAKRLAATGAPHGYDYAESFRIISRRR
jgi:LmbE family N-acetylglucosaminyl deacetylase